MQIKTARYHNSIHTHTMTKIRRMIIPLLVKDVEQLEISYFVGRNVHSTTTLENTLTVS